MGDFHSIGSIGIEATTTVDKIIEQYINVAFQKERESYPDIDDEKFKEFLEIRNGWQITRYYNPFYNGNDNYDLYETWGYYWKLNDHTLRPIIPAPNDAQVFQVKQLLLRKQTLYHEAIAKIVNLMLKVEL